jgi:hypothetical protein
LSCIQPGGAAANNYRIAHQSPPSKKKIKSCAKDDFVR